MRVRADAYHWDKCASCGKIIDLENDAFGRDEKGNLYCDRCLWHKMNYECQNCKED